MAAPKTLLEIVGCTAAVVAAAATVVAATVDVLSYLDTRNKADSPVTSSARTVSAESSPIDAQNKADSPVTSSARTVSAESSQRTFECKTVQGAPTTVVKDSRGERQVIRWISHFGDKPPQRRCQEVSNRMNTYSGKYIAHGVMNGQNVICMTDRVGADCPNVLYELKPGQDPQATLRDFLEVNRRDFTTGPLLE